MIDLHLHLDGSLSLDDFRYLAKRNNVDLGKEFPNSVYVPSDCTSLEEYLTRFDLPLKLLQDKFSIEYAVRSLINRLYEKGYIYAEIRFAPQLHTLKGLSQEEVVLAAIDGLKDGLANKDDFAAGLILCAMRQADHKTNIQAIELADKYRKYGVIAVDLAGPEAFHTGDYYQEIFNEAKKRKLNITIHAGEACGSDEVIRAVSLLHAKRIGHGVHLELNEANINYMTNNRIGYEFCPTSNLQTTSLPNYKAVPIKDFLRYGILVGVNSDNMTVSNTDVLEEYKHLYKTLDLQKWEIHQLLSNSIEMSFTSPETKIKLQKLLNERFDNFYKQIVE